ncbi:Nucleoside diphosphate kinase [Paragonimus heterotremus]|uniref:Nucleoside diphosphate kinase n=1 Tax=Paragonimus heterotremus TaxID=100268 RepID=A0A8J4SIG8_9TREM|nr:Nucleoside diphosphate kinase [Paragonimus heterotremus]
MKILVTTVSPLTALLNSYGPTYSFIVEWYDPYATIVRTYVLGYHSEKNSVEMKTHKLFLKSTKVDDLKLSDFYLGSCITVLSRTLRIIDFADNFTKKAFVEKSERCVAFIRPDAVCEAGRIISSIEEKGFRLVNLKMLCLTSEEISQLFEETVDYTKLPHLLTELSEKLMIALELMCDNACARIREVVGSATGDTESAVVANSSMLVFAKSVESAACQAEKIFGHPGGPHFRGSPQLVGTTLAVIKPHAVAEGNHFAFGFK